MSIEGVGHRIFSTNVLQVDWDNGLETRLLKVIEGYKEANPTGVYRSNAAGTWHSDDNLLTWAGDAGSTLTDMFRKTFIGAFENIASKKGGTYKLRLAAWAMVYTDRGYATVHSHPNCHMSSVYYVKSGESPELTQATGVQVSPGTLEFVDTRGAGGMVIPGLNFQPAARIEPKDGRMLVFPSWLPHFVHPVRGDESRVSVACNCTILNYQPPKD